MLIKNPRFEISVMNKSQYPKGKTPEIVLAGKSNVGKSSLINALLNRNNFARTSSSPGKTQTINFYNVDEKLYLVDLPGYGFAQISKQRKAAFSSLIEEYLNVAPQLAMIVLLVDIRHKPGENDKMMLNFVRELGYKAIIVLTKKDKLSRNEQNKNISIIKKELEIKEGERVLMFSSVNKDGVEELWSILEEVLDNE